MALEKSRAITNGEGTIGSKLDSVDTQYYEQRTKIIDELEDALETLTSASFQTFSSTSSSASSSSAAASSSQSSAGADSTNVYSQLLGRLSETARVAIDAGRRDAENRRAKRARIADEARWLGLGAADADALRSSGSSSSSSSESSSEEEENEGEGEPLPTLGPAAAVCPTLGEEAVSSSIVPSSVSICEPHPISEPNDSDHSNTEKAAAASASATASDVTASEVQLRKRQQREQAEATDESPNQSSSNASAPAAATPAAVGGTAAAGGGGGGAAEFEPLQLKRFRSLDELLALGAAHLAAELRRRGMKCGGTPGERAQRLWQVRDVRHRRDIPKFLLAKPAPASARTPPEKT